MICVGVGRSCNDSRMDGDLRFAGRRAVCGLGVAALIGGLVPRKAIAAALSHGAIERLSQRLSALHEDGLDPRHYEFAALSTSRTPGEALLLARAEAALKDLLLGHPWRAGLTSNATRIWLMSRPGVTGFTPVRTQPALLTQRRWSIPTRGRSRQSSRACARSRRRADGRASREICKLRLNPAARTQGALGNCVRG